MNKIAALAGVIFIAAAAVWTFGVKQQFNQRFPDGWRWEVNTLGLTSYADSESGAFPEGTTLQDDPINLTLRTVTAESDGAPSGLIRIDDHFVTTNPVTNTVDWEYTASALIDPATGQYEDGDAAGDYYFIPPNPSKTTYTLWNSSYQGIEVAFQREEVISGVPTYLYSYRGDYDNKAGYPDQELQPNQTIICFDFQLDYWVEPNTGEILKYREWCEGDWVVNTDTRERLFALSRWGAEPTGDDLIRQSIVVQGELNQYRLVNLYLPLALFIIGFIALGVGFAPRLSRRAPEPKAAMA
jgi:hypothetical protein